MGDEWGCIVDCNLIFTFYIQEKDYLISWCTTMSFFYSNCD